MLYPGCQRDKDKWDQTPLMIWIEHRQGEPIPQELFYDGCQTNKDIHGRTPLMIWIEHRKGEAIPKELYYDGYQSNKDKNGWTALMLWEYWRPCERPPCGLEGTSLSQKALRHYVPSCRPIPIPDDMKFDTEIFSNNKSSNIEISSNSESPNNTNKSSNIEILSNSETSNNTNTYGFEP